MVGHLFVYKLKSKNVFIREYLCDCKISSHSQKFKNCHKIVESESNNNNVLPHETVICADRDPGINTGIKNLINDKNIFVAAKIQKYSKNLRLLQNMIVNLMNDTRDRYYSRISNKLNNSHVSRKASWSNLIMFLNRKNFDYSTFVL